MTIERMNEEIKKCEELLEVTQKKRDSLIEERDREVFKQTQKIFAKHHISIMELMKLQKANEAELKKILEIDEGGKLKNE